MLHHTLRWSFSLAACMILSLVLVGCNENTGDDQTPPPADRTSSATDSSAPSDETPSPAPANTDGTPSDTEASSDAATPDIEQAANVVAYPLDVCLVSDEALGSMGEPIVLVHEGQEVKLCCKGCIRRFNSDPDKFIGKLSATE